MQIDTTALLTSQQQAARAPQRPSQPQGGFAPLEFKQAAPQAAAVAAPSSEVRSGPVRLGSQIDIKV